MSIVLTQTININKSEKRQQRESSCRNTRTSSYRVIQPNHELNILFFIVNNQNGKVEHLYF